MSDSRPAWVRPAGRPARVALVPAAGSGSRAGQSLPKQYASVAGRSLIEWTLSALLDVPGLDAVFVALSADDPLFSKVVSPSVQSRVQCLACGGATRAQSVWGGLQALGPWGVAEDDWVLVHDAARSLIRPQAVGRLIAACEASEAAGGILAVPVADTLKRAVRAGTARVETTVSRDGMWAAQTPQMFRCGVLQRSLGQALAAGVAITDEASAIEHAGLQALLVQGDADNFKITYPGDFVMAEALLGARERTDPGGVANHGASR